MTAVVHWRETVTSGDTMSWSAGEATFDTNWPNGSSLVVAAWDGQLAIIPAQVETGG